MESAANSRLESARSTLFAGSTGRRTTSGAMGLHQILL